VFTLAICGVAYESVSQARDRRLYLPPGRLVDIGGYALHLYCTGEGSPTVILEHGLDGSYLDWRLVQPEIARFTRVCSYDRAGYGYSESSPKRRVPSVMAEELHRLLAAAGEKPPFILVGHSMASFNAVMYAHRYPDELAGLVLVDGSHAQQKLPFPWKEKVELRFLQLTTYFGLPRWRKWCAGRGPEDLRPRRAAVNCRARVFRTHYEQWAAFPDAAEEARALPNTLTLPIVVISRDPDAGGNASQEKRWADGQATLLQLSPDCLQVVAKGSGHNVPGERPDVIVAAVQRLLERLHSRAGVASPAPAPKDRLLR
jgi:pimeloyl-ACP methyl ester carboxylesterase